MRFATFISAGLFLLSFVGNRESFEPLFVGADRCRLCHGSVYRAWKNSVHAGATDSILGKEHRQGCLECHATGPNVLPGVQCESCHGAGGNYWYPEVMMDPAKARGAGLVEPTESVCPSCHGSSLPDHSSQFSMPGKADWLRAIH